MEAYKIQRAIKEELLRPYASVFFCYTAWIGFWFALLSFFSPRTALAGLFSLACTWMWGRLLFMKPPGNLHLVNGLLCGLFLTAHYPITLTLIVALVIITVFLTVTVNWLTVYMWHLGKIPLMTLPFVLGTWLVILVFQQVNLPTLPPPIFLNTALPDVISWQWSNDFFSAVGGLFLIPYPITGALIFLGLFFASRYLVFLAISGYIVGALVLYSLGYQFIAIKTGYNFMLVSIALGGIFMVPGLVSYFIALGASALSGLFTIVLFKMLDPSQLPVLIMPFLLSTYFWIGGLGPRLDRNRGMLYLDYPISPEIAWDNARISHARGVSFDGSSIIKLFQGEWLVEYDETIKSSYLSREVNDPEEKFSILAPAEGIILSLRNTPNNHNDVANAWDLAIDQEWGSFILMRDRLGQYYFLPKLKPGSILPQPNEWVGLGQAIAECGKSEDNSRFCLYLQIQKGPAPWSDKIPYRLVEVLNYKENTPKKFNLSYNLVEGDYVSEVSNHDAILASIHLPPGLKRSFQVTDGHGRTYKGDTQTGMTALGQPRVYASRECSVAYELSKACLAFYDKQGPRNLLLDLYILSMSVSPLTKLADIWFDEPSVYLWPLSPLQRLLLAIVRPLGLGCKSEYTRTWDEDLKKWVQNAVHRAYVMPGVTWEATTTALIDPFLGFTQVTFKMSGKTWEAVREI